MNIVTFPNRDMVVLEGYDEHDGKKVTIKVYRGAQLMGAAAGAIAAGAEFEVNHPGGACWGNGSGFPQVTPDILPGDRIVVELEENGQFYEQAESVVQGGAATRVDYTGGTTLTVTGTVPAGVDSGNVEQRIVNPDLTETPVQRRDLRALVSDTMQPGPRGGYTSRLAITGDTFTAFYDFADSGAAAQTVARAAATGGGERFMNWQLTDSAGNRQGLTIAEMGEPGGPGMGGCPAGPSGVAPTAGTYGVVWGTDGTAQVRWSPAASQPGAAAVTGYSVEAVQRSATDGEYGVIGKRTGTTATRATLSGLTGGTDAWTIEVRALTATGVGPAFPAASGAGGPGGGTPDPDTTAPTVAQTRGDAGSVVLTPSEANADVYYTTDGSDPLGSGGLLSDSAVLYTAPIAITAPTTLRWVAFDAAGNHGTATEAATFEPPAPPAATAPAAPVGLTARPGNGSIALSWTAPATTGGAPIEEYTVKVTAPAGTPSGTPGAVDTTVSVKNPVATTVTVPNLGNGREYTFSVTARNSAGTGPASAEVKARPGDVLTASLVRNKAGDKRIAGSGSQSGVTVRVYQTSNPANVGNPTAAGTISLGTATSTPAVAPATGITWELRLRTAGTIPAGAIVWVQSTGGGITQFRV